MSKILESLKKEYCEALPNLAVIFPEEEFEGKCCLLQDDPAALHAYFDMFALRDRVQDAIRELATFKPTSIDEQDLLVLERVALADLLAKIRAALRIHCETEGDTNARSDRLSSLLESDCVGNEQPLSEPAVEPAPMVGVEPESAPESSLDSDGELAPTVGVEAVASGAPSKETPKKADVQTLVDEMNGQRPRPSNSEIAKAVDDQFPGLPHRALGALLAKDGDMRNTKADLQRGRRARGHAY